MYVLTTFHMQFVQKFLILLTFSLLIFSCSRDKVMDVECDDTDYPTYDQEIKGLINATCAYTGCHSSGFGQGDYTSYETLSGEVGTTFLTEIRNGDMPPDFADGPKVLTEAEIMAFECWAQGGYLEN